MSGLDVDATPNGVRVSGDLGFATPAESLRRAERRFTDAVASEVTRVDVSGIDQADSATLAVLLAWSAHARRDGRRLRYEGLPSDLLALAKLADATDLLDPREPGAGVE